MSKLQQETRMNLVIGTVEDIWLYNRPKGDAPCHLYQKCMWCGLSCTDGNRFVDAMYWTKEGWQWSGESIHESCNEERDMETKKKQKLVRLQKMLG